MGALDITGLTYLPRIHIYRDTYLLPVVTPEAPRLPGGAFSVDVAL
jgi:hypothetical protein